MADTRELPDLDTVPPHLDPSGDSSPWACQQCGQPVTPTTSGRKPRLMLCDEHRKTRATGSSSGSGTTTRAGTHHDRIKTGMQALHGMLAFGIGMVSIPTGSPVWTKDRDAITANAENIAEQWAKYCDDNPKMRKAILSFLETAGAISLAGAYIPVVIAVSMNHKGAPTPVPPPSPVAQMPQSPPTPFQPPRPPFVPPPFNPPQGSPIFQPTANGNGLPFATDVIE